MANFFLGVCGAAVGAVGKVGEAICGDAGASGTALGVSGTTRGGAGVFGTRRGARDGVAGVATD